MDLKFHGAFVGQETFKLKKSGLDAHKLTFSEKGGALVQLSSDVVLREEDFLREGDYHIQLGVRNFNGISTLFIVSVAGPDPVSKGPARP